MHNIVTIYRFKTPLLDVKKELEKLQNIILCIRNYLKLENLEIKYYKKEEKSYIYKFFEFDSIWKIIFTILKSDSKKNDIVLPIFKMDIFLDISFLLWNKKKIVSFLTNIFECFDGINEKEYLIEIDKSIYYKKWLFKKVYPNYDFQDMDSIEKIFNKKNGVKLLSKFIEKYNNWFVLNMKTSKEYHQVNAYLLYLIYLLFTLKKTIYGIKEKLDFVKNYDGWEYAGYIKLQEDRLKILGNNTIQTYKKYLSFLKNFLNLFEKKNG